MSRKLKICKIVKIELRAMERARKRMIFKKSHTKAQIKTG